MEHLIILNITNKEPKQYLSDKTQITKHHINILIPRAQNKHLEEISREAKTDIEEGHLLTVVTHQRGQS